MQIGPYAIGDGAPLALVAGINVLESEQDTLEIAQAVVEIAERHEFPLVFKASFDKANRARLDSYRGPRLDEGIDILRSVKRETGLPLLTDVHEPLQAKQVAEVVDCLQVPAFLCRQTDLLVACAKTERPVNVKKGQFLSPLEVQWVVDKLVSSGTGGVMITERGTSFGYGNLVADLRGLVQMRQFAPVCFDATHVVQYPGAQDGSSGGDRTFVTPLARAAVATGIDALFVETHPLPDTAPCDGPCQIDLVGLDGLLAQVRAVDSALRGLSPDHSAR